MEEQEGKKKKKTYRKGEGEGEGDKKSRRRELDAWHATDRAYLPYLTASDTSSAAALLKLRDLPIVRGEIYPDNRPITQENSLPR